LIVEGRLPPGSPLPATRSLARDLGVSRNTVVGAYLRLDEEGFLETREQIGTFVAARFKPDTVHGASAQAGLRNEAGAPIVATPPPDPKVLRHRVTSPLEGTAEYDFWIGRVDVRLFPVRAWHRLLTRMLRQPVAHLCQYGDPQGLPELRTAIATYVAGARGIAVDPSRVLITNGIQEGLSLLARLLVRRGNNDVVVENPCYRGASAVFASCGARLRPVAVDHDGIDPAGLPASAALAYVTPSHQYPLGSVLTPERRQALLEWAGNCGAYILEDDYDGDFYYDRSPLPALKSQERFDQVVYLGTFSKSLGAGMRIGYMILPRELIEPVRAAKALLNNCQPWLEQAALAAFLAEGGYARHLRRLRQACASRRDHLLREIENHLPGSAVNGAGSGMHLAAHLPDTLPDAEAIEEAARARGVGVYSVASANAQPFGLRDSPLLKRCLLFGYAALNEAEISDALLSLRRAIDSLR